MANNPTLEQIDAELRRRQRSSNTQSEMLRAIDEEIARRAQVSQGFQGTPGYVSRQQTQADPSLAPEREAYLTRNYTPQAGGVAGISQGATAYLGDELEGGINALAAGAEGLARGGVPAAMQRGRQAYEDTVDTTRLFVDRARREHPGVALTNEIGGGVVTGAALGGVVSAPQRVAGVFGLRAGGAPGSLVPSGASATERGLPLWLRQTRESTTIGSAYGYGAGAGANPGNLQERMQAGNENAAFGATIGAFTPAAVNLARGAAGSAPGRYVMQRGAEGLRAVGNAFQRVPTPDPNSVGVFGGNLGAPRRALQPRQPRTQPTPIPRQHRLVTLADRAHIGSEDFAAYAGAAQREPGGQRLVDAFGDAGVRQFRPIVQSPGRTGQSATQAAEQRFDASSSIINNALRRRLQVGESRTEAIAQLEREYAEASAELYQPMFARPTTPQQQQLFEQRIAPLLRDPILQDAMKRGEEIFAREARLGVVQGGATDNLARYLHYIKMGLDDAIGAARRNPTGIQSTEMRGVQQLRARYLQAMDEIIPGYQQARSRWAGIASAEDALEEGAGFLRLLPDEVQARVRQMTPFELRHARIGFADEVRRAVRGQVVGNRNTTNGIMNDPDAQAAMAHLFDTPAQAAEFLDIVNTQNRLMRNAGQWGTGSQTQGNQAYEADGVAAAVAEFGGDLLGGRWGQAVNRAGRQFGNLVSNNMVERSNNEFGEVLLRPIDTAEARAFVDEVVRLLRQSESERALAGVAARTGGAAGATVTGGNRQ